ncbi:MAG: preprotein translocase subunit SecE [Candidatus Omnitrophota bacterium]|nr:preprotein translocase subunit SecE [Candidatus Omnitrophota bacterium]
MEFIVQNFVKIILAITVGILLVFGIKNYTKIKKFILEVKSELTKVSWSTRQELMGATVVVIAITSITAVFIGIIDLSLSKILSLMFR